MKRKLYVLLVGINAYTGKVSTFTGCINDAENVKNHLTAYFNH